MFNSEYINNESNSSPITINDDSSPPPTTINDTPNVYTDSMVNICFEPNASRIRNIVRIGSSEIIISKDIYLANKEVKRKPPKSFALLSDPIELFKFVNSIYPNKRNFYEVIIENMPQKPRFDLDFPHNKFPNITREEAYYYLQCTLDAIEGVMRRYNIIYSYKNNCLVSRSHGKEKTNIKYSFHIIIDKLRHINSSEAHAFYHLVANELAPEIREKGFLDNQVYSIFQNFRLLFNQKLGSNRIKVLDEITEYVPSYHLAPDNKFIGQFVACLLSFTNNCPDMPHFINENPKLTNINKSYSSLTDEQYDRLIDAFDKQYFSAQYRLGNSDENMIFLIREDSGICPTHNTEHDNSDGFISCDEYGNFWFNCYRKYDNLSNKGIIFGNMTYGPYISIIENNKNSQENDDDDDGEGLYCGNLGVLHPGDTFSRDENDNITGIIRAERLPTKKSAKSNTISNKIKNFTNNTITSLNTKIMTVEEIKQNFQINPLIINNRQTTVDDQFPIVVDQSKVAIIQSIIVTSQPEIVTNQSETVINQLEIVNNQPEIVNNQPEIVNNQPEIVTNQLEIAIDQPEVVINQSEIAINQSEIQSSNSTTKTLTFNVVPAYDINENYYLENYLK